MQPAPLNDGLFGKQESLISSSPWRLFFTKLVAAINLSGGGSGGVPTGTGFRHVTAGAEDAATKLVQNADVHATAGIVESKLSLNYPTHSNANDPTTNQKAALVGTGTPSGTDPYVNTSDTRLKNLWLWIDHTPYTIPSGTKGIYIDDTIPAGVTVTLPTIAYEGESIWIHMYSSFCGLTLKNPAGANVINAAGGYRVFKAMVIGGIWYGIPVSTSSMYATTGETPLTPTAIGAVIANAAIVAATKTKITYDTKGLVTSGSDITAADILPLLVGSTLCGIPGIDGEDGVDSYYYGTHATVTVTALPLTILDQAITFNYDTTTLGLSGNNLYVKNDGHTHATQYLKLDGSNANSNINISTYTFTAGNIITPKIRPVADSTTALKITDAANNTCITLDTTNYRLGVFSNTPEVTLDVTGNIRGTNVDIRASGALKYGNVNCFKFRDTDCLFIGRYSGLSTGSYDIGIGDYTLRYDTGGYNAAIGTSALGNNTSGQYNAAYGSFACWKNTEGWNNFGFGASALLWNVTGSNNVGIGTDALKGSEGVSISNNTAIGVSAGQNNNANGCVFLGLAAGQNNTTASRLMIDITNTNTPLLDGSFATRILTINDILNVATGYRIAGAAASGNYLRGNGTNFVSSAIQAGDIPDLSATYAVAAKGVTNGDSHDHVGGDGAAIIGLVPVGSIIAWHKTFTNTPALPAQFVECNGQTLSDAGSVYNGQVIPNLNGAAAGADLSNGDNLGKTGDVFLRGDETSGATEADRFQGHYHNQNSASTGTNDSSLITGSAGGLRTNVTTGTAWYLESTGVVAPITDGTNGTPRTGSTTRPRNMSVVWVIRIK